MQCSLFCSHEQPDSGSCEPSTPALHLSRKIEHNPYSQRDCRGGKGDSGGAGWGGSGQQSERWDANPASVTTSAGSLGLAVADVAPSARAGLFRGAVASLPAFPQRLVALRHVVEASYSK